MERARIIREIQRTAAENGGVPLGSRGFEQATGVKQSEWRGRYWARWGDALAEAGFERNEPDDRIPVDRVIESVIALARRLGHYPTVWELRLERRTDVTFPSETVIRKRLGNRNEAVTRVAGHYYGKKGYEDVIAICEAVAPEPGSSASAAEPGARDGWVYLIKSGKFYKIGRAFNFERRSRSIGLQLPERGLTVHTIRTDDPVGIEAYWHQRFAAKRKGGEWFDLTARDVAAFKRRKSFM